MSDLLVQATVDTEDGRLTAGRIYRASLIFYIMGEPVPGWRFLVQDDKGDAMTFNMDVFKPVDKRRPLSWKKS